MKDDKNIVDVEFQDVKNEIYLTAPQIAQKINDSDIRVRHWADVFGDLIGIEKLNGRKRYKESDVYKFAFIKDLLDNKNFKHDQARVYLAKHGFKYAEYDSGLVNPKDPLGFEALASALTVDVNNKLNQFASELVINISNQLNEHLVKQQNLNMEIKAEIESSVDDKLSELVINQEETKQLHQKHQIELKDFMALTIENEIKENLNSHLTDIKCYIDTKEQETKQRDLEMIDMFKQRMEERKKQTEEENNKSFWSKLFKKDAK